METITERPVRALAPVGEDGRAAGAGVAPVRTQFDVERTARAGSARGATVPAAPTPGIRRLLAAFCCLTAAAVVSLVVLADRTDETFAWTIEPAATAGFLGSGYAAGLVLSVLAVRSRDWDEVRVPFLTVLVFAWITTGATFFHLHRLHVRTPGAGPVAEAAAWLWIAVYVVVPVAMAVLLPRGSWAPRRAHARGPAVPMPRALTRALVGQGLVLAAAGVALVVRCLSSHGTPAGPGTSGAHGTAGAHAGHAGHVPAAAATHVDALWPWTLSPLGCGTIAAWLLAFAVAVALCVADGDLARLRIPTRAYTAFGAFQLLNVVRFRDDVAWSRPAAWVVLAMAVAVTATGAAGWRSARLAGGRPANRAERPAIPTA